MALAGKQFPQHGTVLLEADEMATVYIPGIGGEGGLQRLGNTDRLFIAPCPQGLYILPGLLLLQGGYQLACVVHHPRRWNQQDQLLGLQRGSHFRGNLFRGEVE